MHELELQPRPPREQRPLDVAQREHKVPPAAGQRAQQRGAGRKRTGTCRA